MKIIVLNNALEELKKKQQATLYGLQEKEIVVVSSLKLTKGLKKIGVFYQNKEKINKEELVFFFNKEKINCLHTLNDKTTNNIKVEVVNYTTDFNKRNKGIVDESVLQKRNATIIGLGSGGSAIAVDLVRCGVTNLNLIEFDTVSISNLCRSVYDLPDIGKKKTESLHEKLLRINPRVNIKLYDEDILNMDEEKLMGIIDESDLIIEATDNVNTKRLINGKAYQTTPILYPGVYESGKGGDILLTMPGLPCWECIFNPIFEEMKSSEKREWNYSTGQPKPMPALISDIQVIVARTVKIALSILISDRDDSLFDKITEPGCTMLFIGNEKNVSGFSKPFQESWAETKINPECICQTLS